MDQSHREIIDAPLLADPLAKQIRVAVLLDSIVIKTAFDLIADSLDVAPSTLYVQGVIEVELLMHHAHAVVGPHVKETELGELARSVVEVAVAHVAVRKDGMPSWDVLLEDRDDMGHSLVPY
jgi:hypothetical protein